MLEIEPIDEDDALTLLKSKISLGIEPEEDARGLVQALECTPLAIILAAAYISEHSPEMTIRSYLKRLSPHDQRLKAAQFWCKTQLASGVPPAVLRTFHVSFEHLKELKPEIANVLSLFSMFDPEGVPVCLFHGKEFVCLFGEEMKLLIRFSIIQEDTNRKSLRMHRTVQQIILRQLDTWETLQENRRLAIKLLGNAFPSGGYTSWEDCQSLVPHCKKLMQETASTEDDLVWIKAMERMGYYFRERGELGNAEAVYQRALRGHKRLQGTPEFDLQASFSCARALCAVQANQGNSNEAEPELRRMLETQERLLGEKHLDTVVIANDLAWVLAALNKSKEAETYYQRSVDRWQKCRSHGRSMELKDVTKLGLSLGKLGKHKEAEPVFREVLGEHIRLLGQEHPKALKCAIYLADTLIRQGKRQEAETSYKRHLPQLENALGLDHLDIIFAASNFGLLLRSQGKYEEAEPYIRRAFVKLPKLLGPRHLQTLGAANNLALLLHNMSKDEEAEKMIRTVLKNYEETVGLQHPQALKSSRNLALILEKLKKYKEAEKVMRQNLRDCERVLGHAHPDTIVAGSCLNSMERRKG